MTFSAQAADADVPAQGLSFSFEGNVPAGASINPDSGLFTWTPTLAQAGQTYGITVIVTDNGIPALNAARTFNVTVASGNTPPTLVPIGNKSATKGGSLAFAASATDSDTPAQTLTFSLDAGAPEGAAIDPVTGVFTWTPSSPQGPGTFPVTITVTDNGAPSLSASETIIVDVVAVNTPPILASIKNANVAEGSTLSFPVLAGDREGQRITYSLAAGAPEGARISTDTQTFSWTPAETQGPGTYSITVQATDDGTPPMSDAKAFTVTVLEVNTAPTLASIPDQTVSVGATVNLTATATDADLPAQKLSFLLDPSAPTGATLDAASGVFAWTPSAGQASSTATVTIQVIDNGSPALTDQHTFNVIVEAARAIQIEGVSESAPGVLLLRWTSENQRVYRVQYRDNLTQAAWQNLGEPVTATDTSASKTDSMGKSHRFYRIMLDQ